MKGVVSRKSLFGRLIWGLFCLIVAIEGGDLKYESVTVDDFEKSFIRYILNCTWLFVMSSFRKIYIFLIYL